LPCMEGDGLSGSLLPGRHHRLILAVLLVLLLVCLVPDTAAAEVIPTNDLPPSTPLSVRAVVRCGSR
jgi:hypothetical protein